jgi:hypothetical protein
MDYHPEIANRWLMGGVNYPRRAGNHNPYHELVARVIYNEEGSALTGRDVLCLDGTYRKCQSISLPGDCDPDTWKRQIMAQDNSIYDVNFFGPFSLTTGN